MDILTTILIAIIIIIFYLLLNGHTNQDEKFSSYPREIRKKNKCKKNRKKLLDQLVDDIVSWDDSQDSNNSVVVKKQLNPNFIDAKFHNDYRDIITAINNIIPDKKQLFNIANVPLHYSEPEVSEVKNIVVDFISVLNKNLISEVPNKRNVNSGWDEAIPDPNMKSGWDKAQEALGLAPSLYEKPAPKCKLNLIAIKFVQKYETEDEIKYSCQIVVQKANVEDQLVLKVSFVQDKRPLRDENNFFVTKNIDMRIIIEDVYIVGYLSKEGTDYRLATDGNFGEEKYFDYNNMEKNDLTDPKYVQKILMDKYKQRMTEVQYRNAMLDEEGQTFHKGLPNLYEYPNIKATRTIFDDMNYKKKFI